MDDSAKTPWVAPIRVCLEDLLNRKTGDPLKDAAPKSIFDIWGKYAASFAQAQIPSSFIINCSLFSIQALLAPIASGHHLDEHIIR